MFTSLIDILQKRKVSRAFSEQEQELEIIDKLTNAAQLSASCFNNQPWRFLFQKEQKEQEKGRKSLSPGNSWAKTVPLLIVGFSKKNRDCQIKDGRNYYLFELGMSAQLILLQATELNLVARPISGYSPQLLRKEFNFPEEFEVEI
jgi:nitroreductase